MAQLAANEFDQVALANYFYRYLDAEDSTLEEITLALYGLAYLDEPVLNLIINLLTNADLQITDKIYLVLALDSLGASEYAREIYYEVIDNHSETSEPYIRIVLGEDEDDYLKYTILMAILANRLETNEEEYLFTYICDKYPTDILINIEKLIYLQEAIPTLPEGAVSFDYEVGNRSDSVSVEKYQRYKLPVSADELDDLEFSNISGNVGVISYYSVPTTPDSITCDSNISVTRTYSVVGGQATNLFSENDIVKVTIDHNISANAIDDRYQVTDYLPSGLTIMANPFSRLGYVPYDASWPYLINGQLISFNVWESWDRDIDRDIVYFARIRSLGQFKADPVMMQGYRAKDSINMTNSDTITIQ